MPTGYTAYIEDGEITTGKDFLLLCSRAFGVAVGLKDEPLSVPTPTKFEPSMYHKEKLEEAKRELENFQKLNNDEILSLMKKSHEKNTKDCLRYANDLIERNAKYTKVRAEVERWIPPTANHKGIKEFALEQIDMCTASQECIDEYISESKRGFDGSERAIEEYAETVLCDLQFEIDYHQRGWESEVKGAEEKTEFMRLFIDSLS